MPKKLQKLARFVRESWMKVPKRWREEIISGAHTFVTAAALEAGIQFHLYGDMFPTDKAVLFGAVSVVLRAGLKALFASFFPKPK